MRLQGPDVCLSYDKWELTVYDKKREALSACLSDLDYRSPGTFPPILLSILWVVVFSRQSIEPTHAANVV